MKLTKEKRLLLALSVTVAILLLEVVGGILSNSLALLSDAGHVFTDGFAIALSLVAAIISLRPSDYKATFGYQRIGLLAAVINGLSLLGIAIFIFFESYKRFIAPPVVKAPLMLSVAGIGLVGNIVMALILSKGHHDLNIKSAWLHIMGDLLASVGVVFAGMIIYFTNFYLIDPIAGFIVGVIILFGGLRVVREALHVFLELSPPGYHVERISKTISEIPEVEGIHDVHLWSISHGIPAFSAHIWIRDRKISEADIVREKIEKKLAEIGIKHTVLQLECAECRNNVLYCQIHETKEEHHH